MVEAKKDKRDQEFFYIFLLCSSLSHGFTIVVCGCPKEVRELIKENIIFI